MPERPHQRTRNDHAIELAEDYVEAIAAVIGENGVCRAVDLVHRFGVTHATVNNTIGRLQRDGLVTTQPYRPIQLTQEGKKMARRSQRRHDIVSAFLIKLGVSKATAAIDSEGIEHHVSEETLRAMRKFIAEEK
ncbi:MAG: manganese-binding transcriptional regulator MntR [Planctomycetota bacterium]